MEVYLALIHYPVYNKNKEIVTTCITSFDLHDLARSALTFGIKKYFVVNPLPAQLKFAERVLDLWKQEQSLKYNSTRVEAFRRVELSESLEDVLEKLGKKTIVVATSARTKKSNISYLSLGQKAKKEKGRMLVLLGTGWGLAPEVMQKAHYILPPILGKGKYNHLSVRAAGAIIFDRLFGGNEKNEKN